MDEHHDGPEREDGYAGAFRALIDRPTPELDADRLWLRIEPRLAPRSRARWAPPFGAGRTSPRFIWGSAALAVVTLTLWVALSWQASVPGRQIVLLTPERPDGAAAARAPVPPGGETAAAGAEALGTEELFLEGRLVRGYDGAPPDDVGAARAQGMGGADALRDARSSIERLLPFESFGLVGGGRAALSEDATLEIDLSRGYRFVARSVETSPASGGTVRVGGIELESDGPEARPVDLSLEPGKLYILGVLAPGKEHPELVLLIRAQPARPESR